MKYKFVDFDDNEKNSKFSFHPFTQNVTIFFKTVFNPKILNNQNIFSTPNQYSSLYVDAFKKNTINIDTEMIMKNDNIIEKTLLLIFIKSLINNQLINYQAFATKLRVVSCKLYLLNSYARLR